MYIMIINELSLSYNLFQAREEEDGAEREGSEDCGGDHQVPVSLNFFSLSITARLNMPQVFVPGKPFQVMPNVFE